jgi:hypothetical protein
MSHPVEQTAVDLSVALRADASTLRGGATRLARRLRSQRPDGSLSSNKISLLSHLARHGTSTRAYISTVEHHQAPEMIEQAERDLLAAGMIAYTDDAKLMITESGERALAEDGELRDAWLVGVLADMSDRDRRLLREAGELMTRIANLPGFYQHLPTDRREQPAE